MIKINTLPKIAFVRHGMPEQYFNEYDEILSYPADAPLSKRGKEDIFQLGNQLKEIFPANTPIIASPYARTRETAAIIRTCLGGTNPIIMHNQLVDVDMGDYDRKPVKFIPENYYHDPKVEPLSHVSLRAIKAFDDIRHQYGENVIIVGHRDPLLAITHWLEKRTSATVLEEILSMHQLNRGDALIFHQDGEQYIFNQNISQDNLGQSIEGNSHPSKETR